MNIAGLASQNKIQLNNKWLNLAFRIGLYLILAAIMLKISWYAWPDLIKDFGIELYIPWRITEGDVLYHDIVYYHGGPLSPYWNAFWFYLFGTSINTLIIINLILLAFLIYLLEDWLSALSDRFTATIAVLFFISVFAFGRYVGIGNYNYVTPYLHFMVHGLILSLAMLASMRYWTKTGNSRWLFVSGLLLGLTILTKIEIYFASINAAAVYLISFFLNKPKNHHILSKHLLIFIIGLAVPLVTSIFLLANVMSIREAISNIFGQWIMLWDGRLLKISNLSFYRMGMGTDNIIGNILKISDWLWKYFNVILIGILLTLNLRNIKRWHLLISALIISGTFLLFGFLAPQNWTGVVSPLPLIMMGGLALLIWRILKHKNCPTDNLSESSFNYPLYLASFAFAGTLLLKMILNTRIYHYGFALTMPATMLLIIALVGWLPKYLNRYGAGWAFRSLALGLLLTISIGYIKLSINNYSSNNFICCPKNKIDIIRTNQLQGSIIAGVLHELENRLKPGQSFVAIPEVVMLNYLSRHRNPTPYIFFMPDLFILYKETDIINSFIESSPDFIVFIHIDTSEYGFPFFGRDYGVNLYSWLNKNYKIVWQKGGPPLKPGTDFGVILAEKIK